VIGAAGDGGGRGLDPLLVTGCAACRAHPGGDDQPAPCFGQGADQCRLARAGDDAVGPGLKGSGGAGGHDFGQIAGHDQSGVKVGPVKRGQDRHGKDPQPRTARALLGRANHMRVAVNGQEIQIILGNAPDRCLDRGADVKELHVKEDALAMFLLQLIGKGKSAPGQHAKADLVKAGGVADLLGQFQPGKRIRHVQRHDQTVVHGSPQPATNDPLIGPCLPT